MNETTAGTALTDDGVRTAFSLYRAGADTCEIAVIMGVHEHEIYNAVFGKGLFGRAMTSVGNNVYRLVRR